MGGLVGGVIFFYVLCVVIGKIQGAKLKIETQELMTYQDIVEHQKKQRE